MDRGEYSRNGVGVTWRNNGKRSRSAVTVRSRLEKAKQEKEAHGEIETAHPGYSKRSAGANPV